MEFFDKLGKKASETYHVTKEKASNLSEELKIRGKNSELKESIEKKYLEIGKIVYNEVKDGKDVSKDVIIENCNEISRMKDEISKLETQLLTIKKVKKCIECNAEIDITSEFCPKCGKAQPKIENVEVKEEPKDVKEVEVTEVNNVENNNSENNNVENNDGENE